MNILCEYMMSSTKPEVRSISQQRQKTTEPRPPATCTENWWSSAVWFSSYASGQTNRQTDIHTNEQT